MKKYFFIFTLSVLFSIYIKTNSTSVSHFTQIVINSSSLDNPQIIKNIENELSKIKGISFYEVSLQTQALLVNYNDKQVNDKDILNILKKWGCESQTVFFNPIFN